MKKRIQELDRNQLDDRTMKTNGVDGKMVLMLGHICCKPPTM